MIFSFVIWLWVWSGVMAEDSRLAPHSGYVVDTRHERSVRVVEVVLVPRPEAPARPLQEQIFDERLTREFQVKYEERFGRTESEQRFNQPSRFTSVIFYDDSRDLNGDRLNVEQYHQKQQQYGEFMMKRLTEHHIDQYAKSDPSLRPIYEMKDRLSHLDMEVRKGYKVKFKYALSSNDFTMQVENPYEIQNKVTFEMGGFSDFEEVTVSLGRPVTKRILVSSFYRVKDGIIQLVGRRQLNSNVAASLLGSRDFLRAGRDIQQDLILVGLTWNY